MNIKEAKTEIINTIRAYNKKDDLGCYTFPLVRQRPILLMGPPGIGKTAIMEQAARECRVGLVAYTITHHTRQSAIGLPHIETKIYQGKEVSVTEYTLSEIIASVYRCMEDTGNKEGILFIDEINCVSETLAPTMLQFLQNKTFGSHKVPRGWIIVAAGNPPQYNKSVREFDIVTLDRVRKIDVEADCDVWMEYACRQEVHQAILSYLRIKKENFYSVENTVDGKFFVTARGWEDLSEILKSYEAFQIPITEALVSQYLQKEETARDFTAYYQLYRKYGTDYGITDILEGSLSDRDYEEKAAMAGKGGFEERFTVVNLLMGALHTSFAGFAGREGKLISLHEALGYLKNYVREHGEIQDIEAFIQSRRNSMEVKIEAGLMTEKEIGKENWVLGKLEEYCLNLKKEHIRKSSEGFERIKEYFSRETHERSKEIEKILEQTERAFRFAEKSFGDGQEMVLFVSGLTQDTLAMDFLSLHESPLYMKWSEKLLYRKEEEKLLEECRKEEDLLKA